MSTPSSVPGRTVGVILAGGFSRRFGSPKALARIGDLTLIERVLEVQRQVLESVIVSCNDPDLYADLGVPLVPDSRSGLGPLAGIEAALRWAGERGAVGIICTPCDTPFVSPALLLGILQAAPGYVAVVPEGRNPGEIEPQVAWYGTGSLPVATACLGSADRSLRAFVARLSPVRYLESREISAIGDPAELFMNVNNSDDLVRAKAAAPDTA